MAGALRKVSQNYNWTIKRADNDLHRVISATPRPQTPSPSHPDVKPVTLPVPTGPWDSNHLRWKFRTDYEELREHLSSAFIILLSWMMSIDCLLRAAVIHFIWHPICSIVRSYEESIKLANTGIRPTSIRSLLVLLFRCAAPLIFSLLRKIFAFCIPANVKTFTEDKTDTTFTSRFAVQPASAHLPAKSLHRLSSALASAKDKTGIAISNPAPSLPITSLVDDFQDETRTMRTVVHDDARRLFRRNPSGYHGPECRHEYAKKFTGTLATY